MLAPPAPSPVVVVVVRMPVVVDVVPVLPNEPPAPLDVELLASADASGGGSKSASAVRPPQAARLTEATNTKICVESFRCCMWVPPRSARYSPTAPKVPGSILRFARRFATYRERTATIQPRKVGLTTERSPRRIGWLRRSFP
jgi:hypothetical protein